MPPNPLPTTSGSLSEGNLAEVIFREYDSDLVGELLRRMTFRGEGFGCYSTFEVRDDARKWEHARKVAWWHWFGYGDDPEEADTAWEIAGLGEGYSYDTHGFSVEVCWYWDGDGVLTFCVRKDGETLRRLVNTDCKKDYRWETMRDA